MLEKDVPLAKGVKNVKGSGHLKRTAAERNDVHEKTLISHFQRKVITRVTSLPNHSTGRKSSEQIRSRENASYLRCYI